MAQAVARCLACYLSLLGVSAFVVPPNGATLVARGVRSSLDRTACERKQQVQQQSQQSIRRTGVVMMGRRAAKIAAVKGKSDLKRAKCFARIGKKLAMAVKTGGPNEESNKLLADTIKEAKLNNVPKDNVTRAIKKASEGSQEDFKEMVYEAYGHGGTGLVITALTDNVNRAIADVKTVWRKHGLKQAAQGSVMFQFDKKGRIEVQGTVDEEQVIEAAIEAGVEDVEVLEGNEEGTSWVLTDPKDLTHLAEGLHAVGIEGDCSLALIPSSVADVDDEALELNLAAVDALMELDDVDSVEHNMA